MTLNHPKPHNSKARTLWLAISVAASLVLAGCTTSHEINSSQEVQGAAKSEFVSIESGQFMLRGQPYRFVGMNMWFGAYLGADEPGRERLAKELDLLKSHGVDNLRVLGASELSPLPNSMAPAFQDEAGNYNEELLVGLDHLLAQMAERDMRAVIFLNNFWEWSGGMTTYLHWDEGRDLIELGNPDVEFWPAYAHLASEFYNSEAANLRYRNYVAMLLERTNSVNGRKYTEDPTIMSWQLANEPRPGDGAQGLANMSNYVRWIDETTNFIADRSPHQLISIGNEGTMGCVESDECFERSGALDEVDYLTVHLWAKNWGWIDTMDMEATLPGALDRASNYVGSHVRMATKLGKPLVLEEFGLPREGESIDPQANTEARDKYLKAMFDLIEANGSNCGIFAGSNIWAWAGFGRAHRSSGKWENGDTSFTGDPPQEPQGLNSVYSSDTSTLKIVRDHAEALKSLESKCANSR